MNDNEKNLKYIKAKVTDLIRDTEQLKKTITGNHYSYRNNIIELEWIRKNSPDWISQYDKWDVDFLLQEDIVCSVNNFKLSGDEIPFFSEEKLYELVGKEDARSILSLINNILKKSV